MNLPKILCHHISINVIIHVLILFSILSALFAFYITKLEKQAFRNEMQHLLYPQIINWLKTAEKYDPNIKNQLKILPLDVGLNIYQNENKCTQINNNWILNSTIFIIVTLFLILIAIYVASNYCFSLWKFALKNIVIFIFVGLIEIGFFLTIAVKFVPSPPSTITKTLINAIKSDVFKTNIPQAVNKFPIDPTILTMLKKYA